MKYKVVDLFAGAGGLSLGFLQTGKFEIKVAFEKNDNAKKTYFKNHPNVEMQDDVCRADYKGIIDRHGEIDVVIGGPPCQGFSNANRQKNQNVSLNNMLIKQYVRAIIELKPKAFVLENVSMLKSKLHRFFMETEDEELTKEYGIKTTKDSIKVLLKEYYIDGLFPIIKDINKVKNCMWQKDSYMAINTIYKHKKNITKAEVAMISHKNNLEKIEVEFLESDNDEWSIFSQKHKVGKAIHDYNNKEISMSEFFESIEKPLHIQKALLSINEIYENKILIEDYSKNDGIVLHVRSYAIFDYIKKVLEHETNGYKITSGILNAAEFGAPQKRMRFVAIGVRDKRIETVEMPKGSIPADRYSTVHDAISDIASVSTSYSVENDDGIILKEPTEKISDLGKELRNSKYLCNHIITKTTETALERFEALNQGENFQNLKKELKENTYTDSSRTQSTIYLRLKYNAPSGTVVNVRKSMWIHPIHNRALSIREAARLQTFPDSFVFVGSKDSQYQQVGNAVPPILAKAIAEKILEILEGVI